VFLYIKSKLPLLKKREKMGDWYTIGAGALGTIGNLAGMGMQNNTTSNMMNQQMQNQMALNEQMQDIQQQNWDYTNFENQRKHMEKAGLNVGLMYGMGGAGGTTMGGASGGSAASGQAAHAPNFMEVGQQILQARAIEAQTKVAEADAKLKNAQADKTAGVDTQVATKSLEYTDNQIKQIASLMGVNEADVKQKLQNIEESKQKVTNLQQDVKESQSRIELNEQHIKESVQKVLESEANVKFTNERVKYYIDEITNDIRNSLANQRNSYTNEKNADTNTWKITVDKMLQEEGYNVQKRGQIIQAISTALGATIIRGGK
jgi:hypothetical protein